LLADLIGQPFAAPDLDDAAVITACALQIDYRLRVIGPFRLQGLEPVQAVGLHRIVRGQFEQGIEGDRYSWLGRLIGLEKLLVATEQETAHTGFQIDGQFYGFIGIIDHPVRVLDPLDHRQQIGDQQDKERRADDTDTQRQADVAAQEFTESLLINRRRRGHGKPCRTVGCHRVCPKSAEGIHFSDTFFGNILHFTAPAQRSGYSSRLLCGYCSL
jgi:hypothetical protein